jgi:hypothetical protein
MQTKHSVQSRMKSSKSASSKDCRRNQKFTAAPFPRHSPVNGLHSVESKELRFSFFLLTQKIEGVKHNCSLTVSEVFPVGAASGGQARSPSADCQSANARESWATNPSRVQSSGRMTKGGPVRLYSKALVEENRKPSQGQDRVPKR